MIVSGGSKKFPSKNYIEVLQQFDEFNGKTVALRKVTEDNSCYIFGFPLSFMEIADVKNMIDEILIEFVFSDH